MRLALFDLDHTLLPIDSADTWSHFVVNKGGLDPVAYGERIEEFAQTYRAGTFDIEGYVRFQMELLALFPRALLDTWHRQFMEQHVRPHIRSEALALVDSHRKRGDELALVTGTNAYVVTPIAHEFGIEHVLAVQPEITLRSNLPEAMSARTPISTARYAKSASGSLRAGRTWDDTITICYGDSINDLPLLEHATHPVVTNGDSRLIAIAHERGWQTLRLFEPTHMTGTA